MKSYRLPLTLMVFAIMGLMVMSCNNESANSASTDTTEEAGAVAASDNSVPTPAADAVPVGPTTTVEFSETKHDYGMIEQGEKVSHVFTFKNTGNEPLVLSNVKPSCGCTTPSWTKEPVAPGEEGEILVEFDSKGKSGKQTKTVTITANTEPAKTVLTITGEIQKAEDAS